MLESYNVYIHVVCSMSIKVVTVRIHYVCRDSSCAIELNFILEVFFTH